MKHIVILLTSVLLFVVSSTTSIFAQIATKVKNGKRYEKTVIGMDVYDAQTNQKIESFFDLKDPKTFSKSLEEGDCDCPEGNVEVVLWITLDYMGAETFWSIHENPNQIPYDGWSDPTYVGPQVVGVPQGTYPNNVQGTVFLQAVCLPTNCFSLVFGDEYGDGMGFTSGHYELYLGDSLLVSGGGNFGQWASDVFCIDAEEKVDPVFGCMDINACNFYPGATIDDASCIYPGGPCEHLNPFVVEDHYNEQCECVGNIYYGCTDSLAFNFNELAGIDDGSCFFNPGCTLSFACNYDPDSDFDDGTCEFLSCQVIGCTDYYASNYNPEANTPDPNLCEYESPSFVVVQSCNQCMIINTTPEAPIQGVGIWWEWQFGDNTFLVSSVDTLYHTYEQNGSYTITLNYFQGANFPQSFNDSVIVDDFEAQPNIEVVDDQLVCDAVADTYTWYCDNVLMQTTETPFWDVSSPGSYHCVLERVNGCSASTDPLTITSVVYATVEDIGIFPNPSSDFITIDGYTGIVSIFDDRGRLVVSQKIVSTGRIDVNALAVGTYFIQVEENGHSAVKQFVKR